MDDEKNNLEVEENNSEVEEDNNSNHVDSNENNKFFHDKTNAETLNPTRKSYSDVYPSTRPHHLKSKAASDYKSLTPNKNSRLNPNVYRKENDAKEKKEAAEKAKANNNEKNSHNNSAENEQNSKKHSSIGSSVKSKAKHGAARLGRSAVNGGKSLTSGYSSNQDDSDAPNSEGRQTLGNVAKKVGNTIKKGIKLVWRLLPLTVKLIIILILLILFIIFFVILYVASDDDSSGGGGGSGDYGYDYTALATNQIDFLCSMTSPLKGYTVNGLSGWRWHPIDYVGRFHYGIDISTTTEDTGIYAVGGGTVSDHNVGCIVGDRGCGSSLGNYVEIRHPNGFITLYAHMSKVLVKTGDEVKQGQKIGIEGTTGSSTGDHLHFEVYDDSGAYMSSNPFFDYSDEGYEYCLNPNGTYNSICDNSMSQRSMGAGAFQNICNSRKYDSSTCGENAGPDALFNYIGVWEGSQDCDENNYKVYDDGGGTITVGHGVTDLWVIQTKYTADYIKEKGYQKYFDTNKIGNYKLKKVGSCYPKTVIDNIQKNALKNNFSPAITNAEKEAGYTLKRYEHDALTDLQYLKWVDNGTLVDLISTYKKDHDYKKVWKEISSLYPQGEGYRKRAKGCFALFVTGDYTDGGRFYNRSLDNFDDYNSEGVMARVNACANDKTNITDKRKAVLEIANREYNAWPKDQDSQNTKIITYLNSCSGNYTFDYVTHYCQGFVSYVLKQAGVYDQVAPSVEGQNCLANNFILNGGQYKAVGDATYHTVNSGYVPKPGDLVFFDWDMESFIDIDHIGIVESVDSDGYILTIEGNTSSDDAPRYDGLGKVDKKRRSTATIRGYLEW